jgi:hypothetical protein
MKFLYQTIVLIIVLSNHLYSQNSIVNPTGDIRYVEAKEINLHEKNGNYYNESWNYLIALDNDSQIYINILVSHFGRLKKPVSSARMSLLNWDGKDYKVAREYSLDLLQFEEDRYRMMLHPDRGIWFEGILPESHKIVYRTKKDGIHYDINLELKEIAKAFTWGNGIFRIGKDDQVGIFSQIPRAKVSGFIALDYDTVSVQGFATMTQNYQTNLGVRLFEKSYKYYIYEENYSRSGFFLIPKDKSNSIIGYAYEYRSDGSILIKKPVSIQSSDEASFIHGSISKKIEICYEKHPCENLSVIEIDEKDSILDGLSGLRKFLAKRFLGGNIIELRGIAIQNDSLRTLYSVGKIE